jgi:hypothetical protein
MTEHGITKREIISELTKSPHGDLAAYLPRVRAACQSEPEFTAHLIAWNAKNGQVRDAKVALPSLSLGYAGGVEFEENAEAHLALLDPRNLLRAVRFCKTTAKPPYANGRVKRLVARYLRAREEPYARFDRVAVQHRAALKELYALLHIKPSPTVNRALFQGLYPAGSLLEAVRLLSVMSNQEAAGTILEKKIPFLAATGALGKRAKEPDLVLALIQRMSPAELVTNTGMLERLGLQANPALRSAFEEKLNQVAGSKQVTLKTTRAAAAVKSDTVREKLRGAQERQMKNMAIEGDWLVLGDKSGSMERAIDVSRHVATTLAALVKGRVHLVFFDVMPRYVEVTGKTYDQLLAETKHVSATGGTSIGCGLRMLLDKRISVDGIAIVSDAAENSTPFFAPVFSDYVNRLDVEPTVYLYKTDGERTDALERSCEMAGIDLQRFDLRGGIDYYSLPNLVATMRVGRYSLVEEIMATPLRTLTEVFGEEKEEAA